jgi:hypothetical protein
MRDARRAESVQHNARLRGLFPHSLENRWNPTIDSEVPAGKSAGATYFFRARESMKDSSNTAKLLDLPYTPEAEEYLDELERSGQFRVGLEAEIEDTDGSDASAGNDYGWGRGSGSVSIQDWWTSGRVTLHVGAGITPGNVALARVNDSLVVRTQDGLDRLVLEGYLGLLPPASTLIIIFSDGIEWFGDKLLERFGSWLTAGESTQREPGPSAPNH